MMTMFLHTPDNNTVKSLYKWYIPTWVAEQYSSEEAVAWPSKQIWMSNPCPYTQEQGNPAVVHADHSSELGNM